MRGTIQNKRVEISQEEAQQYLKLGKVAHVATVDEEGFPYVIGHIVRIEEESKKEWFFDALLEKYGNPEWTFEREGYPIMPKIELFEVQIEKLTGKINHGMYH
ncbi:hypothetical protein BFZC1_20443 [Lysinibacillus fusiformis ZC1]|nr:hypothetical protein BFZC1_20443 [Lysinibacillus fusiformis ZC1]EKU43821.1 hypothetical protein C518_1066 [Lysinibacillus fusiformis ZB2]MBU5250873.1 hypothetical protein [Lysinibacillus capsici]